MYTLAEVSYASLVFRGLSKLGFPQQGVIDPEAPHPGTLKLLVEIRRGELTNNEVFTFGVIMPSSPSETDDDGYRLAFTPYYTKPTRIPYLELEETNVKESSFAHNLSEGEYLYLCRISNVLGLLEVDKEIHQDFHVEVSVSKPVLDENGDEADTIELGRIVSDGASYMPLEPEFYSEK